MDGFSHSEKVRRFLFRWFVNTVGVLLATSVVKGIECDSLVTSVGAALVLGVLNAFLRPILMILSLPLVVFSFGIFALIINALLLYLAGALVPGFHVDGLWSAFWGALLISLVSMVANLFWAAGLFGSRYEGFDEEGRWKLRGKGARGIRRTIDIE